MAITVIGNWSMTTDQLFPSISPSFIPDTTATTDQTWCFEFFEILKSLLKVVSVFSAAIIGVVTGLVIAMVIGTVIPAHPRAFARYLPILFGFFIAANAYCECGYTFQSAGGINYLTTDLIESDFMHSKNVFKDTDWRVQGYSVTAQDSRGPYG